MFLKKLKLLKPIFILLLIIGFSSEAQILPKVPNVSQKSVISQTIGITDITITYHRPAVKGRNIWGALVPYGYTNNVPWRTGANSTTTIEFSHEVSIGGVAVSAGIYGLYSAIFEDGSAEIIISSDSYSFGSFFYDPSKDVARVQVKTEVSTFKEFMAFEFFEITPNSAELAILWENLKIPVRIDVNTNEIVIVDLIKRQNSGESFDDSWHFAAATFCMNNNVYIDQGIKWAQNAMSPQFGGSRNVVNLTTYANLLLLGNKDQEANKVLDEAFDTEGIQLGTFIFYSRQVLGLGFPKISLKTLQKAKEIYPEGHWPINITLVRVYSAMKDYNEALKFLDLAENYIPKNIDRNLIDQYRSKLKAGKDIN